MKIEERREEKADGVVVTVIDTPPAEQELANEVAEVEAIVENIVIETDDDYKKAADIGRMIKRRMEAVKEFFAPMKKAANDAHKKVCENEKSMTAPLTKAEKIIKSRMSEFVGKREKARAEAEERMRLLAKEETDKLIDEAVRAERNGDSVGAEMALASAEVMENAGAVFVSDVKVPKADGVSESKDWEIVSVNDAEVPVNFAGKVLRPIDIKAVQSLIRSSKGTLSIPGIEYKEVTKITLRK